MSRAPDSCSLVHLRGHSAHVNNNKCYYVLETLEIVVNKTDEILCPHGAYSLVEGSKEYVVFGDIYILPAVDSCCQENQAGRGIGSSGWGLVILSGVVKEGHRRR